MFILVKLYVTYNIAGRQFLEREIIKATQQPRLTLNRDQHLNWNKIENNLDQENKRKT